VWDWFCGKMAKGDASCEAAGGADAQNRCCANKIVEKTVQDDEFCGKLIAATSCANSGNVTAQQACCETKQQLNIMDGYCETLPAAAPAEAAPSPSPAPEEPAPAPSPEPSPVVVLAPSSAPAPSPAQPIVPQVTQVLPTAPVTSVQEDIPPPSGARAAAPAAAAALLGVLLAAVLLA
jgi:hypothetical protein